MTDSDEECTICLEVINHESMTGVITGCSHYYHQACILQWSSNSNACPTCRNNYNSVKLKRKNSQKYHGLVQIPNRVLQNDAINDIPREFIISANCPRGNIPHQLPSDGICMVCSSVDYLSSSRAVIACGTCGSNFHQGCLGMLTVEDEIIWYCPLCE